MRRIWNTVLKGLVAILPIGLTLYIVYWLAVAAERLFSRVIKLVVPDQYYWPGLGLVAGLLLLYAVGLAVNAYIVRRVLRVGDDLLARIRSEIEEQEARWYERRVLQVIGSKHGELLRRYADARRRLAHQGS